MSCNIWKTPRTGTEGENSSYTSVPETPWPIITLAAALTLAGVVLRRKRGQLVS